MPRALRRSRSSFSPPPKSALSFERNEGLLLPLSFSSPEELSPAAAPDDEDAAERTTTRDREALPLFSPPGSGRAERGGGGEEERVDIVDLDGDGGDGRIGARSLRAGAAAALLGSPTREVPSIGTALVIVQRISLLREKLELRREKTELKRLKVSISDNLSE